jgi:hypothetical protein
MWKTVRDTGDQRRIMTQQLHNVGVEFVIV